MKAKKNYSLSPLKWGGEYGTTEVPDNDNGNGTSSGGCGCGYK